MNTTHDDVIREAVFDKDAIIKYHWVGLIPLACLIIPIPIVIIVAIIYKIMLPRIVNSWSATLTTRSLLVKKGVFNKLEKTIPLEKITDLSSAQGPIMRHCGLKRIGIETAGQSGAAGASLVSLLGIVDTDEFRARVLAQRDLIADSSGGGGGGSVGAAKASAVGGQDSAGGSPGELREIADTLGRIEAVLDRLAAKGDDAQQ